MSGLAKNLYSDALKEMSCDTKLPGCKECCHAIFQASVGQLCLLSDLDGSSKMIRVYKVTKLSLNTLNHQQLESSTVKKAHRS